MTRRKPFLVSNRVEHVLTQGVQLLDELFEGRPYGWRDSEVSLRDVANQWDVSLSSVYRCVATASMWMECGRPELHYLSMSHLRELLSLETEVQKRLLQQAEKERWTVARIHEERLKHKRRGDVRGGRPARGPSTDFALKSITSWVANPDRLEGIDRLRSMCPQERKKLLRSVRTMCMELEMVAYRLMD